MIYQKKNKNKGQMDFSFGTIFSIILIIAFIAFAIVGISKFMKTQHYAQVETFKRELQTDIDKVWRDTGEHKFEYSLPKKISEVCFREDDDENIYFFPAGTGFNGGKLNHVDFSKTIPAGSTSFCIKTADGEVNLYIKRNFGEQLVTITK